MSQWFMPSGPQPSASTRGLFPLAVRVGLAAFLAILPLILYGCSCGHDQVFHIQGWLDAAQQLRHGHYPRWSYTSAWNAGEPRFLFYPPLSWLLGATLTLIFPIAATPTIYIFLALLAAGLTFHHLASNVLPNPISPHAALLAAALYLANPYMLFNAFERSAYAELLAAAWIPLLLLAILRPRPTIRGIALPIALLWLTNAPAAVMGCYTLALLATLRLLVSLFTSSTLSSRPERSAVERSLHSAHATDAASISPNPIPPLRLALTCIAGTLLGLTLPAFYLLPAAYERRYVQVAMAIVPGMRPQDNFLFTQTANPDHNGVNLQISLLALTLIVLTLAALITLFLLIRKRIANKSVPPNAGSTLPSSAVVSPSSAPAFLSVIPEGNLFLALSSLALVLTFLLLRPSTFLWLHVPDLVFLQLPWRLLTLLTAVLALTLALLLNFLFSNKIQHPPSAQDSAQDSAQECWAHGQSLLLPPSAQDTWVRRTSTTLALALALGLGLYAFHLYAQSCQPEDLPATIAQDLSTHHGFPPTDEYAPTLADNDLLRTNDPAYWLLPSTADPNTPGPNTTPTELNPPIDTDDNPIPLAQTLSAEAPDHLTLNLSEPETLVLNLRDYPNWSITRTTPATGAKQPSPSAQDPSPSAQDLAVRAGPQDDRDDGLIAIELPAGPSTIVATWHRTPDQTLGLAISAVALIALALTFRPKRP